MESERGWAAAASFTRSGLEMSSGAALAGLETFPRCGFGGWRVFISPTGNEPLLPLLDGVDDPLPLFLRTDGETWNSQALRRAFNPAPRPVIRSYPIPPVRRVRQTGRVPRSLPAAGTSAGRLVERDGVFV